MAEFFASKYWLEEVDIVKTEVPLAIWETLYVTLISTLIALMIGLPLGVLLAVGDKDGIIPLPAPLRHFLNILINLLRSVPFLILIVVVAPLTRLIIGKAFGTAASIVPLVIAAFPFIARLVESSVREVNPNIIEMSLSMGATTWQTVFHVMLPESVPSLITSFTTAITTILGYTAMSGAVGGGGLGNLAITQGQQRYNQAVLLAALIVLVLMVQLFQTIGTRLAKKADKRIKQ